MHAVIKNILQRKSETPPFRDRRKIALVLFGGNMIAIRSAAALLVLERLGLSHIFDSIYTVSAGFPIASYFLSKQMRFVFPMYYRELTSRKFINFWRLWRMVDMNYLLNLMQVEYKLRVKEIYKQQTDFFVRFRNVDENKLEYFEVHDFPVEDFWKLMEAAVSLPFFNPGSVQLNGFVYMDTVFYTDNLEAHIRKALDSDATDILVFYNHLGQRKLDLSTEERVCEIYLDPEPKIGHFTRDESKLLQTGQQMADLTAAKFGSEKIIIS